MPQYVSLSLIERSMTKEQWLSWLTEEVSAIRERFGSDEEALIMWPDDYYEKMEA